MIPHIDLRDARETGGPRSREVAAQLRAAATTSGFFYVGNHGIAPEAIAAMFDLAQQFFALPDAAKAAVDKRFSPIGRGYSAVGAQTLDRTAGALADLKENFNCGIEYDPGHPYVEAQHFGYGPNQWPAALPQMPAQCRTYIGAMSALARRVMQLLALSLDLPETYFDGMHANPLVTIRLLRYPPHPADAGADTFGAGAHRDWGAITLLAQDDAGGLDVCLPDGTWVAAPPVPGTFVVNFGDMIPRWTNGRYHSNPHRVRNAGEPDRARYSVPFFYDPDYATEIAPLPGCVTPSEPLAYAPCLAGEHLAECFRATYA